MGARTHGHRPDAAFAKSGGVGVSGEGASTVFEGESTHQPRSDALMARRSSGHRYQPSTDSW